MAKPSWVSVSPLSGSGNSNVSIGATTNGGLNNRSGTITVVGSIGGRTITKTITVSQSWSATVRLYSSYDTVNHDLSYTVLKSNFEDSSTINSSVAGAEKLQVGYPYNTGSNICNYLCQKMSNGLFAFTLDWVHILLEEDSGEGIDDNYWDIPNAWFIPATVNGAVNQFMYTPVIDFSYNPSTGEISIIRTLSSIGGAAFEAAPGVYPDKAKLRNTGRVGFEANGYGCFSVLKDGVNLAAHHWYPKFIEISGEDETWIVESIQARCMYKGLVPSGNVPSGRLDVYTWTPRDYTKIAVDTTTLQVIVDSAVVQTMDDWYHPQMDESIIE